MTALAWLTYISPLVLIVIAVFAWWVMEVGLAEAMTDVVGLAAGAAVGALLFAAMSWGASQIWPGS